VLNGNVRSGCSLRDQSLDLTRRFARSQDREEQWDLSQVGSKPANDGHGSPGSIPIEKVCKHSQHLDVHVLTTLANLIFGLNDDCKSRISRIASTVVVEGRSNIWPHNLHTT
jgi:hypothetical protein